MVRIAALVVSTKWVVKMKEQLPFAENSSSFVLKFELLLIMFSKLAGEVALKDLAF